MAINQAQYDMIKVLPTKGKSLLCLGYPDMLIRLNPDKDIPRAYRETDIARSHRWEGPVYDTDFVMRNILGFKRVAYYDIANHRGRETLVDLNYPVEIEETFDFVMDFGTLEHCWNISQGFKTVKELAKEYVVHSNPLNIINHGFWNISPTTYVDFYEGHNVTVSLVPLNPNDDTVLILKVPTMRFNVAQPIELSTMAIIKLNKDVEDTQEYPVQTKYKGII